jgi:hypothetical protein
MYQFLNSFKKKGNRTKLDNGFLRVENAPILHDDVMKYRGSELGKVVDGVSIDSNKIYNVYIATKELENCVEQVKLLPIVNSHKWIGEGRDRARGKQEGSVGEDVRLEKLDDGKNYLIANMQINDLETIKEIENKELEELSTAYDAKLKKSSVANADFEAYDLTFNHLAIVPRGRSGKLARIVNCDLENADDKDSAEKGSPDVDRQGDYETRHEAMTESKDETTSGGVSLSKEKEEEALRSKLLTNEGKKMADEKKEEVKLDNNSPDCVAKKIAEEKKEKEIENEKEEKVDKKEDKKDFKNSTDLLGAPDVEAIRTQLLNEMKESLQKSLEEQRVQLKNEFKEKSNFYEKVKYKIGNYDIANNSLAELVDFAGEKLKLSNKDNFKNGDVSVKRAIIETIIDTAVDNKPAVKLANATTEIVINY